MNWTEQIVNLIVVILGITIAFYLESWKESRNRKDVERQYIRALTDDLRKDKELVDTLILIDQFRLEMLSKLADASVGSYSQLDSVGIFLAYVQFHVPFEAQRASFEAMTASGNIEIISDFELRGKVFELYSQWYRGMKQFDESIIQHTNQFIKPFITYEIEYYTSSQVNPDFLKKSAFRNMIFSYQSLFQARYDYYRRVSEAVDSLIDDLEIKGG